MAFWGNSFIFNGTPCEDFDLMIYDIGDDGQGASTFASTVTIVEEVIGSRWRPYFYGVKYEKKLQLEIVFGANMRRIDEHKYLDRDEIAKIASWLTGHDQYMMLEIEQDDMAYVRYKCMVTDLSIVSYGRTPWALKMTVTCDGPYAYLYPEEITYVVDGSDTINYYNESDHNGYYEPIVEIGLINGGDFSIENASDNGRTLVFSDVPASVTQIRVNNSTLVVTCDQNINMYPYFNFVYLRLKRGQNTLKITGRGTLKIISEFPVNVGG